MAQGIVYLVGAGPGDPGLLTLRGAQCLGRADVVVYDYLASVELLALAPPGAERIFGGKHGTGAHFLEQEQINELLVERARRGLCVVRLKGGDPMVFGRGAEEAEVLARAGIAWEVVPGVTSALAVPEMAGIPVTHRDWVSGVTVLTGHEAAGKENPRVRWELVASAGNTIVLLMGLTQMQANLAALMAHGLDPATPAAAIRWGTTPRQETVLGTVADLAEKVATGGLRPPVTLVIGEVVRLRESIEWFEKRPLFGRRIVVTRPRHQAPRLAELLREQGAEVLVCPAIEIEAMDTAPLRAALEQLSSYDFLVLTSANGVDRFFAVLDECGLDMRALAGLRIAAIGPQTARRLASRHVNADIIPTEYRAEGLLAALAGESLKGSRVLLPRAAGARPILPDTLRNQGALVDEVLTYRSIQPADAPARWQEILADGIPDCVTFTSSSTVEHFLAVVDAAPAGRAALEAAKIACIGPITAATATAAGLQVAIEPDSYTVAALAQAITQALRNKESR
ncbi:MAG: uroporphyrinogen-III C-methyltransferase [Deltaproteobacteria bacterium]